MITDLMENERLDDLQRNGLKIIQKTDGFCFGMDAVLLSGFASVKPGERALDLGTGTGIIPLLLSAKTKGDHFTGLEIQTEIMKMAQRSVALNGLEKKIDIIQGDIKEASRIFGAASFDVVTTNPPYMTAQHGLTNLHEAKTIARHEVLCNLEDIIRESARLLVPGGRFYMVHRPYPEMFQKSALVVSTAAGAGTKDANASVIRSLKHWGVRRIYSCGISIFAPGWDAIPASRKRKIEKRLDCVTDAFWRSLGAKKRPTMHTRLLFFAMKQMQKRKKGTGADATYWKQQGWLDGKKPF